MYSQEQIERIKKEEENMHFIAEYVKTHTEEQIKEDYRQKENRDKLYSIESIIDNKQLFDTMTEEQIVKYVKYLKEKPESEIINNYYEGKTGIIPNEKKIPYHPAEIRFPGISLNTTLKYKKEFSSMTKEQIEEYIKTTPDRNLSLENMHFIAEYVKTHTEEQIKEDYRQKENRDKLYSIESIIDNKQLFDTMTEEQIVKYVKYLKEKPESEIINNYYEGKTGIIPNEKKIPYHPAEIRFPGISLNTTLKYKKEFSSMTEEQIEEYIKVKALNETLSLEYNDLWARKGKPDVSDAISSIRYLTEQEHSFKNHIKMKLKGFKEEKKYVELLSLAGIGGYIGAIFPNDESKMPVFITIFSILLAAQTAILGYQYTKKWFDIVNSNEKNIELLKKEGMYDLLMDAMNSKKEYEEKYQEEIGRGR